VKTIVFVTLFLGLTAGPQRVEVAVDGSVAEVELRLDGDTVQHFAGPPWLAGMDFGDELLPRRLTAVALDADGAELDRTEQWVNLPRDDAEARLLLEREDGRVVAARLAWRNLEYPAPAAVEITLDGQPLEVAEPSHFELPKHDPDVLHVLSADMIFPNGDNARADVAFGGPYGGETGAALTAVPVVVEGRRRLRRAKEAEGWLRVDGRPAPVLALDRGEVDVYAVLDRSAEEHVRQLGFGMARRIGAQRLGSAVDVSRTFDTAGAPGRVRGLGRADSALVGIGSKAGDRLFLVRPEPDPSLSGYLLFGISPPIDADQGGLAWLLTYLRMGLEDDAGPPRLADATATAALRAAGSGRPRAVLLVLGPGSRDASRFPAPVVRRYLASLRVPLEVWYVESPAVSARQAPEGLTLDDLEAARREHLEHARAAWGEVRVVDDVASWIGAAEAFRDALARQRILWIEGLHPPADVELGEAPEWVRLVADPSLH
jgi:hypothetical protein